MHRLYFALLLLMGCNPEHNPADLEEISGLRENQEYQSRLRQRVVGMYDELSAVSQGQAVELLNWVVVGQAFLVATKQVSNQLVICQSMPAPITGDGMVDHAAASAIPVLVGNQPQQPWVQIAVTADCSEPVVLSLVTAEDDDLADGSAVLYEEASEPVVEDPE